MAGGEDELVLPYISFAATFSDQLAAEEVLCRDTAVCLNDDPDVFFRLATFVFRQVSVNAGLVPSRLAACLPVATSLAGSFPWPLPIPSISKI